MTYLTKGALCIFQPEFESFRATLVHGNCIMLGWIKNLNLSAIWKMNWLLLMCACVSACVLWRIVRGWLCAIVCAILGRIRVWILLCKLIYDCVCECVWACMIVCMCVCLWKPTLKIILYMSMRIHVSMGVCLLVYLKGIIRMKRNATRCQKCKILKSVFKEQLFQWNINSREMVNDF